jgi:predicted DNA-binding ribbon-helix-helix protein
MGQRDTTDRDAERPAAADAPLGARRRASTLVSRNVVVSGRRTSVRLEPPMWDALRAICRREGRTMHEMCTMIDQRRQESALTAAIRVFIMAYFRAAATDEGHARAGHGGAGFAPEGDQPAVEGSGSLGPV